MSYPAPKTSSDLDTGLLCFPLQLLSGSVHPHRPLSPDDIIPTRCLKQKQKQKDPLTALDIFSTKLCERAICYCISIFFPSHSWRRDPLFFWAPQPVLPPGHRSPHGSRHWSFFIEHGLCSAQLTDYAPPPLPPTFTPFPFLRQKPFRYSRRFLLGSGATRYTTSRIPPAPKRRHHDEEDTARDRSRYILLSPTFFKV